MPFKNDHRLSWKISSYRSFSELEASAKIEINLEDHQKLQVAVIHSCRHYFEYEKASRAKLIDLRNSFRASQTLGFDRAKTVLSSNVD